MNLSNPNYDMDFIMQKIADESPTFKKYLESLINDTDRDFPTNELWLGTLDLDSTTQMKLTVSQEPQHFIDEN